MKRSGGFLLLEVLVALAVFSAGIVFVFQALSSSLSAARVSERRFQAATLAEEKVWELEQRPKVEAGSESDTFFGTDLRWEIVETAPEDPLAPWQEWELRLKMGTPPETYSLQWTKEK